MSKKTFSKTEKCYLNDLWMVHQGACNAFLMMEHYIIHVQKQTKVGL